MNAISHGACCKLIPLQNPRGCHPADEQIVEPKLEPRITNSNSTNHSSRGNPRSEMPGEARSVRPGSLCGRSREGPTQRRLSILAHPTILRMARPEKAVPGCKPAWVGRPKTA